MFFYEFFSVIICSDFADPTVESIYIYIVESIYSGVYIQQWSLYSGVNSRFVDRLLYLDAFESRSIPDTETLSLDYPSREMRWSLDANTMQIYTRQTNDSLQCRRLQVATIITKG